MIWDNPSPEEKDEIIKGIAETIYKYDMDLVAVLLLESIKPLASVGSQMIRYVIAPFIPFIGEKSMPYLATFENRENLEKLIRLLEERSEQEDRERKRRKKLRKAKDGSQRKGWRGLWPFSRASAFIPR